MYWLLNFAMEHIRKNKSTHSTCNNETRIHDTSQRAKLYDGNLAMEIDSFPSLRNRDTQKFIHYSI